MLALMASIFVLFAVMMVIVLATATTKTETTTFSTTQTTEPSGVGLVAMAIFYILMWVVAVVYSINSYRNAFRVTQGETIAVGDFFKFPGLGTPIVANAFCWFITYIGFLMLIGPGIIAMFVLMYVPAAAAINPNATVSSAFSEGITASKNNIGQSILLAFLNCMIYLVSSLVGIVGLVTVPLMMITTVVGLLMATGRNLVVPN